MSSSTRNHSNSDSQSYYRTGIQHFQDKNYKEAITYLHKALEKDSSNAEIYLAKSQSEYHLQNLDQALQDINKGLEVVENSLNESDSGLILKVRLLNVRARIYKELQNFSKAQIDTEQVKAIVHQNAQNDKFASLLSPGSLDEPVRKSSSNTNHGRNTLEDVDGSQKQEAQKLYELIQEATEKKLLTTEFNIVHLISMKWFERWRRYSGFQFDMLYKGQTNQNANDSNEGLLKEEHERIHPGPINSDDILDDEIELLADPDPVKDYCNYTVKQGLTENKDFIILSNPVWKYLHNIYSGKDIKRYVVSLNDETNQTSIEIWLKKINILVCPPVEKGKEYFQCEVQTLYMSKKETVKDLREKITRICKHKGKVDPKATLNACRIWKLDPREDPRQFVRSAEESSEQVPLKGKKLTDGQVLEDAELGDTDVVVCEYKVNNSWKFLTEEEHMQIIFSKCGNCGTKKDNLPFCECKTIKYCDAVCQKNHRPKHKEKCTKIKTSISKNNEIMRQFKLSKTKFSTTSRYGICGLQNLGNTCFMNSSLQCLSHVSELTYYFLENRFIKDLNKHNRLGTGGRLAAAYAELMKELWHGTDNYVSPWDIKKIIAEVASQFSGYNQQDAQEFLSYLVDGLHEDLNKIVNKPYVETIESDDRPDEIVAKQSWENHIKRNQSIIVDLMHGQFKSKLICPDCKKISITFDPFMTLSLPIPHSNLVTLPLYFIHKNNKNLPYKIILTLDPAAPVTEIVDKVAELLSLPAGSLELNLLKDQMIAKTKLNKYDVKALKDDEATPFLYQIHDPEVDGSLKKFLEQDRVKTEIQIYKHGEDIEHISFSRLIHISKRATLKDLHLQIYFVMRGYLAHAYPVIENDDPTNFSIDTEKWDMDTLEDEYKRFVDMENMPYQIACADDSKKYYVIQYDATKIIEENIRFGDFLNVALLFHPNANTDIMKINKCHDYENNNSPQKDRKSYTLSECFDLFTTPEVLDQDNLWYCNKCKDHKQATKKMDIYKFPKVLVLHLKRFKTSRVHSIGSYFFSGGSSKITTLIDFPLESLDLSKYALGKWDDPPIYDLFAITNHYGSLGGGHYTAYAKNPLKKTWFDFNDSSVSNQDSSELVSGAAYLLFYKRREVEKPAGSSNS